MRPRPPTPRSSPIHHSRVGAGLLALAVLTGPGSPAAVADPGPRWPVPGPVVAEFDPPFPDWLPGHRGVDLAGAVGTPVVTPAAGVVDFVGRVAGVPVVVIAHGALRASYLPVTSDLEAGADLTPGATIGSLAPGDHCPASCLHWGARLFGRYVDPRLLLGRFRVVLTDV